MPSVIPPRLLDLLCEAFGVRRGSGDNRLLDEPVAVTLAAVGLCDLRVDPAGRIPVRLGELPTCCAVPKPEAGARPSLTWPCEFGCFPGMEDMVLGPP